MCASRGDPILTEGLFVNSLHSSVFILCSAWEIAYKNDSNCQVRSQSQQSRTSKEPERPETTKEEAICSSSSKCCILPCQWAVSQSCPCKVSTGLISTSQVMVQYVLHSYKSGTECSQQFTIQHVADSSTTGCCQFGCLIAKIVLI